MNIYPFLFIVKDRGNPSLITEFSSFIEVLDENDNCPKLKLENPFLMINRDLLTDQYVVQLHAVDRDADANGQVSFESLSSSTSPAFAQIFPNGTLLVDVHSNLVQHESFLTLHVHLRDYGQPMSCIIAETLRLFIGSNRTNWSNVFKLHETLVKEEFSAVRTFFVWIKNHFFWKNLLVESDNSCIIYQKSTFTQLFIEICFQSST